MMSAMAFFLQYIAFSLIAYLQSQQAERRILSSLPCLWILTSWPSRSSLKRETAWETYCIWHSQEVKERAKQKSIQDWILWYSSPSPNSFKNQAKGGKKPINPCLNAWGCQNKGQWMTGDCQHNSQPLSSLFGIIEPKNVHITRECIISFLHMHKISTGEATKHFHMSTWVSLSSMYSRW